jgi:sorbitol-specific phosphotransferase system component IIC
MNNGWGMMGQVLPLLIPLVIIQYALLGFALFDLVKRKRVKGGNKLLWGAVIVLINILGPILYFAIGREED